VEGNGALLRGRAWAFGMAEQQHQDDSLFQKLFPVEHFDVYISHGLRPDGRKLAECRPATCKTHAVATAASSSRVSLGGTLALGGVTLELSVPSDDLPDQGTLTAQVCTNERCRPGFLSQYDTTYNRNIHGS
jgi:hypothetical protein